MELIFVLVLILVWILPSHFVAKYAEGKGQSYWLFMILGLATSFLISWLIAAILPAGSTTQGLWSQATGTTDLDRLEKLGRLHRDGTLTEQEFQAQKASILSESAAGTTPPNANVGRF